RAVRECRAVTVWSPGGAAAGSQGRQPLRNGAETTVSAPEGRQSVRRRFCRPSGAVWGRGAADQGLPPLANDGRPSGAGNSGRYFMMHAPTARRSGYTLVEMLMVVAVLLVLVTLALAFGPWVHERQKVTGGADQLQQWLLTSKGRARSARLPCGVRLRPLPALTLSPPPVTARPRPALTPPPLSAPRATLP